MADRKKENEIIKEQRKTYDELIEIKKAKNGELKIENTHTLEDAMPKTFWGKVKNYAYHYKILIIVVVIIVITASLAIYDSVTRTRPDIEMVVYSYHRVLQEQIDAIGELMTPYLTDINGDGTVMLSGINCSFDKSKNVTELEYTSSTHFQTLLAGDPQAIIFLIDKESYEHLLEVNEGKSIFAQEPLPLNSEIYRTVEEKSGFKLPDGLMICYRKVKGTFIEKEKTGRECYKAAEDLFIEINEKYPPDGE